MLSFPVKLDTSDLCGSHGSSAGAGGGKLQRDSTPQGLSFLLGYSFFFLHGLVCLVLFV